MVRRSINQLQIYIAPYVETKSEAQWRFDGADRLCSHLASASEAALTTGAFDLQHEVS